MKILLFGVSCVGKSTVGQILAQKLNYKFYDLDDENCEKFKDVT
jgi:shikimate kinase